MWYFNHPYALALGLLPMLIAALIWFKKRRLGKRAMLHLSAPSAVVSLARKTRRKYRALFGALILASLGLCLAIAQPVQVDSWIDRWSDGIDVLVVLDVSESMDADDFQPNRITVAKQVIRDFIRKRKYDRIGLVVFGGESITKVPLTRDYDFLLEQLAEVQLSQLRQGTAIGMGLANAIGRLRFSKSSNKVAILLTDGDSNVGAINPMTSALLARQEGIKVYTIGIGKKDRVLVPIYSKDAEGNRRQLVAQVPSYINPELLKDIARTTGGNAYLARDPRMLARILWEIDSLEKTRIKSLPKEKKIELFFWPAALSTLLLAIVFILRETRLRVLKPKYATSV